MFENSSGNGASYHGWMSYCPKRMVLIRNVVGGVGKPNGVMEGVCGTAPGVEGTGELGENEGGMASC